MVQRKVTSNKIS